MRTISINITNLTIKVARAIQPPHGEIDLLRQRQRFSFHLNLLFVFCLTAGCIPALMRAKR